MILDKLINAETYLNINPLFAKAVDYLRNSNFSIMENGRYIIESNNLYALLMDYETIDESESKLEAHRKHIDLHYIISGSENIGFALLTNQKVFQEYSESEDYELYDDSFSTFKLFEKEFAVFFPQDLHMPCIKINQSVKVKKVVVKIKF